MKTLVIGKEEDGYGMLFEDHGEVIHNCTPEAKHIQDVDLICFIGGNDVCPSFYGHHTYKGTFCDEFDDLPCKFSFEMAKQLAIPIVGICKGAQQLCAFNGGALYQDVTNHSERHSMIIDPNLKYEKPEIDVTSSHHQMMDLTTITHEYLLLAWSQPRSDYYLTFPDDEVQPLMWEINPLLKDPEVVYFPKYRNLAVQYHPEWMTKESDGYKFFQHLLEEYLR